MNLPEFMPSIRGVFFWFFLFLFVCCHNNYAQTFKFTTSEGSVCLRGDTLSSLGFPTTPDTMTIWCNEWGTILSNWSNWRDSFKFKSQNAFVKFSVDDQYLLAHYHTPVSYTFRLAYTFIGFYSPDTILAHLKYDTFYDTLTVSFNNFSDNTPYQNLNLKKYNSYYKIIVALSALCTDDGGAIAMASLTDPVLQNFRVEASILTQRYDLSPYGISSSNPFNTATPTFANNYLNVNWSYGSAATKNPVNYELEWTYADDYSVNLVTGAETPISPSLVKFDFRNNSTRVWLDSSQYKIPIAYPRGYIVYRVRAVRPDSTLFKYPVYSQWSVYDSGTIGSLSGTPANYFYVGPFTGDSLNWQYTISFAEGGKFKHVASFFDGLLKNRQSITRFNTNPAQLIATDNVYDYEGRLCIKTLPAPANAPFFSYLHNLDINAVTHHPYQAMDFDTGLAICPTANIIPALDSSSSLASLYYSHNNPEASLSSPLYNHFIPDAQGYPMVQTVFEPGFTDRVSEQGGAGPQLQIGTSNTIKNSYVSPMQKPLNALFGANIGWSSFYTMTVCQDPNQQLSMSVKDYHGKQMASAMIGRGNTIGHALTSINVPDSVSYKQDLLLPSSPSQVADTIAGTITADKDYFNEAAGNDSLQYIYSFIPLQACSGQYLSVKGHYSYYITDQCGNQQINQSGVLGTNGVVNSPAAVSYTGPDTFFYAYQEPYHVHKTLSFYPSDVEAAVDSFLGVDSCLLTKNWFIRQSVDSTIFPCIGVDYADSTPCSKLKMEMMKQLFPGAIYGQYSDTTGHVVGTGNSIFSLNCPPDTFHVKRYFRDSVLISRCYSSIGYNADTTFGFLTDFSGTIYFVGIYSDPFVFGYPEITLSDTCVSGAVFSFTTTATLSIYSYTDYPTDTIIGHCNFGTMSGIFLLKTNADVLGSENGTITSIGPPGSIISDSTPYVYVTNRHSYLEIPVTVLGSSISSSFSGTLPSGHTIDIAFSLSLSTVDSYYFFTDSFYVDSIVSGYSAGTCGYSPTLHYRYQDSCNVAIPDTITVGGVLYHCLDSMSADSFIMIYNEAIAEGNYSIAQALLPLHPQYCELQHCYNDSFKTEVLAIPNRKVAQSLGLFNLDDLIASDPIKDSISMAWPGSSPTDTLRTFEGGMITLDTFLFMNAYCGCTDSSMFAQCYSTMFSNEIQHRLLINDAVKDYYFKNIYSLYFSNRQRILDNLMTRSGMSCSHCALARMNPDPAATIPPAPVAFTDTVNTNDSVITPGSSHWLSQMGSYSDTVALHDSTILLFHSEDSALAYGEIDTIMAHLSNCIAGNPTTAAAIRSALISLYNSGSAPEGNFTFQQISNALTGCGVSMNDLCNPYILDCTQFGAPPPAPVNDCMSGSYYSDLGSFLNVIAVDSAILHPGKNFANTLDTFGNSFERSVARSLGNNNEDSILAIYSTTQRLYQLIITTASGSGDTVSIFLHSLTCGALTAGFSISAACINSSPSLISSVGFINEYSFIATVSIGGSTCTMTGWIDSIPTMSYMNNSISQCIPCTQMRSLYNQFVDTMQVYGMAGVDHPYYDIMLANFMNVRLQQTYTGEDYETFIQSCALADSATMPLYGGYATFRFSNAAQMNGFIDTLNSIDPLFTFNNVYRDSLTDSGTITVTIDLNHIPEYELWKYKNKLLGYPSSFCVRKIVDSSELVIKPAGEIGFMYTTPGVSPVFNPKNPPIIDTSLIRFIGPFNRKIWLAGNFVTQNYYDVVAIPGTSAYTISQAVYDINAYLYNKSVPGTVFVPLYQSTINSDYFKPQKQAYLHYAYGNQSLPSYQVEDSLQTQYLTPPRIPSYIGYIPGYSQASNPGLFTNLYLGKTGVYGRLFDTLQTIISQADPSGGGNIFPSTTADTVTTGYPELIIYLCGDGTYWYRYFTKKDTLFNVYISFPGYIPPSVRSSYQVVGSAIPTPGDSLNRCFTLNVVRPGYADTLQVTGRTDFVISNSIELDNVLMGQTQAGVNIAGADTFDNCERQALYSAVSEGVVNYNNYITHIKDSISGAFKSYLTSAVSEQLQLAYLNQEFNYTLYNYDRAGNLWFTVPPAGSNPLVASLLDSVDHVRTSNTESLCPFVNYPKINHYLYNTLNQVVQQITIDGGQTNFYYDAAGRLIFSQNGNQALYGFYTYNIYDQQNRIIETGEAQMGSPAFVLNVDRVPADSIPIYVYGYQRDDVVRTIYDTAYMNLSGITGLDSQQNLRKRVACVMYFDTILSVTDNDYTYATHYSYDIEGNVQTITQDFPELRQYSQQFKRIDYDYDLISSKVNMLSYNRGWPDQFYQKYEYDADNRITEVHTSNDGYIWKRDALYSYYDHGPLARVQLGSLNVQGIDYAYTIQGWLKAVNSDTLSGLLDMGQDAVNGSVVAKDAVAYTIDYFSNDYKPIASNAVQHISPASLSLFNGNIARQTVAIDTFQRLNKQYIYDQLNRIHNAAYASVNPATGALTGLTDFQNSYSYDPDGNLQSLVRYARNTGLGAPLMDSLIYQYASITNNQLAQVYDYAPYYSTNDIDTFTRTSAPPRYTYDAIGNITSDLVSGQDTVTWNLYNKVETTVNNADTSSMEFTYDGAGNRVAKSYNKQTSNGNTLRNDYYVHDAQGNVLAIYHLNLSSVQSGTFLRLVNQDFWLAEHDIYGSSRIGIKEYYKSQIGTTFDEASGYATDTARLLTPTPWYSLEYQDVIKADSTYLYGNNFTDMMFARHVLGQKQYELTDHLGDVLATISDKRATDSLTGDTVTTGAVDTIASWKPVVVTATDYYPFGMQMPGRYLSDTSTHCYTTTITEPVDYFNFTYYAFSAYPLPVTPYGGAYLYSLIGGDQQLNTFGYPGDSLVINIDSITPGAVQCLKLVTDGGTNTYGAHIISGGVNVGSSTISYSYGGITTIYFIPTTPTVTLVIGELFSSLLPHAHFDLNLRGLYLPRFDSAVLEDVVTSVCNEDRYHYGFNGQLKDNEWAGVGNHLEFKFRGYDPRTGRFGCVDPIAKKYPWNSSYNFAEDRVIDGKDLEGLEFFGMTGLMFGSSSLISPGSSTIGLLSSDEVIARPMMSPEALNDLMKGAQEMGEKTAEEQEHHMDPTALKEHPVNQAARRAGFKYEGQENKMKVPKYSKEAGKGQHANHPNWNKEVGRRLDRFGKDNSGYSDNEAADFVRGMVKDLKGVIKSNPDTKINDLFKGTVPAVDNTGNLGQKPINAKQAVPPPVKCTDCS